MTARLCKAKGDNRRLALFAAVATGCLLLGLQRARADLVQCVVFICSKPGPIPNPLAETSGSVTISTTDGEAVVQNSQSVQWSLLHYTNLSPIHPLEVDTFFQLPVENYEHAEASGIINSGIVSHGIINLGNNGSPFVAVTASSNNSNPYGLALGGATATASLAYQVMVLQRSTTSASPPDGTPVTVDISGLISGSGLTGVNPATSWAWGSADVTIADLAGDVLYSDSATGSIGSDPYSTSLTLTVGSIYSVEIDALVDTQGNISDAHVKVDPSFTIDSSTPDADDLYFLYSDGIAQDFGLDGTSVSVPETSTLSTLGVGLLGVGITQLRRRRPGRGTPDAEGGRGGREA